MKGEFMTLVDGVMRVMVGIAALICLLAAMVVDSSSYMPILWTMASSGYILFYLFAWKRVLRMATPIKELRALIGRGVEAITIDYRRIPTCWHIIVNEELQDAGYTAIRVSGKVIVWGL